MPRAWAWGSLLAVVGLVATAWLVPAAPAPVARLATAQQRRLAKVQQPSEDWKATLRLMSSLLSDEQLDGIEDAGLDSEHVHYLANQLGWTGAGGTSSVMKTRKALQSWLPRENWDDAALLLEAFGAEVAPDVPRGALLRKCLACSTPKLALELIERSGVDVQGEISRAREHDAKLAELFLEYYCQRAAQQKEEAHEGVAAAEGTAGEEAAPPAGLAESNAVAIYRTRRWISDAVLPMRLCPFAQQPFVKDQIRYSVSDAKSEESLLVHFFAEARMLLEADEEEVATTMLIAPLYEGTIHNYYSWSEELTDSLEENEEDPYYQVQPAFFHPLWQFDGVNPRSGIHFEKRAPAAVINLLRRSQLERVTDEALNRGVVIGEEIADHNEKVLGEAGFEQLLELYESIATAMPPAHPEL